MNSRERIFSVLNCEEPDRVPIVPWIGWYASVILGINLDDLARESMTYQPIPDTGYLRMWKFVLESYKKLGVDIILPLNAWLLVAKTTTRESYRVANHPRGILIQKMFDTPKGALTEEVLSFQGEVGVNTTNYIITDPENDLEKVEYVLGDPTRLDFNEYEKARYQVGDQGVVSVRVNSPISFWLTMRGLKDGLLDFFRRRTTVDNYMKMYGKWIVDFATTCSDYQVDLLWIRGTYDSYTIISPDDWKRYVKDPLTKAFKGLGLKGIYFLEGKCAKLLDLVTETGLSCVEPIEPPPQGDCDLQETKKQVGDQICLKGNISPFELQLASPQEVENLVIDRIKVGAPNGGYILSTCDMITQETPIENVYALVKAAKKFGKYPITIK